MTRIALPVFAAIALFIFPAVVGGVCVFVSALGFPLSGVVLGLLWDALYYPGHGLPVGLIYGAIAGLVSFFVRRFIKARIMF